MPSKSELVKMAHAEFDRAVHEAAALRDERLRTLDWLLEASKNGHDSESSGQRQNALFPRVKQLVRRQQGPFTRADIEQELRDGGEQKIPTRLRLLKILRKLEERGMIRTASLGRGRRPTTYEVNTTKESSE
jgi:hypothetical protein